MPSELAGHLMGRGEVPPSHLFVPLTRGYGACLERLDPEAARYAPESIARAARREADLLAPDLLIIGEPTVLAESCGSGVRPAEPYEWEICEGSLAEAPAVWDAFAPPDPARSPVFGALLAALSMLRPVVLVPIACMLPAPFTLARQLGGQAFLSSVGNDDGRWEALLDATVLAVTDAVKLALTRGSQGVVLCEDLRAVPRIGMVELADYYSPCFNVLRHHARRCLFVVEGPPCATTPLQRHTAIGGVVHPGHPLTRGEPAGLPLRGGGPGPGLWSLEETDFATALTQELSALANGESAVFAPVVPAAARPERVQAMVTAYRSARSPCP